MGNGIEMDFSVRQGRSLIFPVSHAKKNLNHLVFFLGIPPPRQMSSMPGDVSTSMFQIDVNFGDRRRAS
jgi:hypothetical protein